MQRIRRRRLGVEAWRGLLARFMGSGLTAQAFCRRESVSTASFYRWRSVLATAPGRELARAVPVGASTRSFVDLGPLDATVAQQERLELRLDLGGGVVLHLVRG